MFNWWRFAIAVTYWLAETAYFGWNLTPLTSAEQICDGIALLMLSMAIRNPSSASGGPDAG